MCYCNRVYKLVVLLLLVDSKHAQEMRFLIDTIRARPCKAVTPSFRATTVEGKRTLQDRPKPLHYAENRQRFARFASKIIHVTVDTDPQDKARYRCHPPARSCYMADFIAACALAEILGATVCRCAACWAVLCVDSRRYHSVSQHRAILTLDRMLQEVAARGD